MRKISEDIIDITVFPSLNGVPTDKAFHVQDLYKLNKFVNEIVDENNNIVSTLNLNTISILEKVPNALSNVANIVEYSVSENEYNNIISSFNVDNNGYFRHPQNDIQNTHVQSVYKPPVITRNTINAILELEL